MSQEIIIKDCTPSFTGKSGEIEELLRALGQRLPREQPLVKLTEMADEFDVAVSLVRYVYDGLEEEGVLLPPKRRQGRPATRIRCEPTRPHPAVTGDENDEVTQKIRGSLDEGLTYREIEERTGYGKGRIQYRVQRGFAPRQHKRRPQEVINLFDFRVEGLRRAGLSYSETTRRLRETFYSDITPYDVPNAVNRLMDQGRIEIPETQEET